MARSNRAMTKSRLGHDERWAISATDTAILARKELDLVISQHEILSLNHGNRLYREMRSQAHT